MGYPWQGTVLYYQMPLKNTPRWPALPNDLPGIHPVAVIARTWLITGWHSAQCAVRFSQDHTFADDWPLFRRVRHPVNHGGLMPQLQGHGTVYLCRFHRYRASSLVLSEEPRIT